MTMTIKNMGEYLYINRFKGSIHMRGIIPKDKFKNKDDNEVKQILQEGFKKDLETIIKQRKNIPVYSKKKQTAKIETHLLIYRKLKEQYGDYILKNEKLEDSIVSEKLFRYGFKDIKNMSDKKIKNLLKKEKKYDLEIDINSIVLKESLK